MNRDDFHQISKFSVVYFRFIFLSRSWSFVWWASFQNLSFLCCSGYCSWWRIF